MGQGTPPSHAERRPGAPRWGGKQRSAPGRTRPLSPPARTRRCQTHVDLQAGAARPSATRAAGSRGPGSRGGAGGGAGAAPPGRERAGLHSRARGRHRGRRGVSPVQTLRGGWGGKDLAPRSIRKPPGRQEMTKAEVARVRPVTGSARLAATAGERAPS